MYGLSRFAKRALGAGTALALAFLLCAAMPVKAAETKTRMLVPVGHTVGVKLFSRGVVVVKLTDGGTPARECGLRTGDVIVKCGGSAVTSTEQFQSLLQRSGGGAADLQIDRDGGSVTLSVEPEQNEQGIYCIGAWVRDSMAGIGTMTYEGTDHTFGALGHGINDVDTSILMNLEEGMLYKTEIVGITRGTNGSPGELTGYIEYDSENVIGEITENTSEGIFGICDETRMEDSAYEPIPIALKQEISLGPAQIICSVSGEPEFYDVEIVEVNLEHENVNRGIVIRVVDEKLLTLTGGIIQGMSGSPIIQNGKLVGAVTHVLVNDSTRGYGIFIEEMLTH